MPSTFSSLKIELIATGEQSGTWGNTTNTNLGTAIEEAITGSADVVFSSADVTVTLTDTNAAQAARNLRLNLTGTSGGARNLILGSGCQIEKLYLINNGLADAVTVKNTSGTGIAVPAGKSMFVYNNGTNVVEAVNSAVTLETTQVNITGQGDLRLEDTSGGQYVALQAPSTVASSYTLTLPVDDGTNGQALVTDGNGVLSWSTAASGDVYGPASATDNAIARFDLTTGKIIQNSVVTIADTTGDMAGVGTLSSGAITTTGVLTLPAGTVSAPAITTTGDTNTGIYFPAADTIAFTEGGAESMRIDSSGSVGIGTTPSAWSGSGAKVLQNDRLSLAGISGNSYFSNNWYTDGSANRYIATAPAQQIRMADDTMIFNRAASGTAGASFSWSESMRIDSSGNVQIGTTSLTVGRLNVARTAAAGLQYVLALTAAQGSAFDRGAALAFPINESTTTTLAYIGARIDKGAAGDNAQALVFGTNQTNASPVERMRITSDGEVYIAGTTDQGAYNLQCNGTGVWGAGAYVNGSDERIKDDIEPLESGLDVVAKLNPVTYKYKEDWSKDQSIQTGFIAQELLTALEGKNYVDGVVQQGGQYMSVAYQNIIPILTKAIQELKAELDATKAEVALLKSK